MCAFYGFSNTKSEYNHPTSPRHTMNFVLRRAWNFISQNVSTSQNRIYNNITVHVFLYIIVEIYVHNICTTKCIENKKALFCCSTIIKIWQRNRKYILSIYLQNQLILIQKIIPMQLADLFRWNETTCCVRIFILYENRSIILCNETVLCFSNEFQ